MAHESTADVYSDAETEKNEHFHYEGHRRADLVFDRDFLRLAEEAPDNDYDSHMPQEDLENEAAAAAAGSSAEDNLLDEEGSWDGDLVQPLELEESHEPHRALVVTLPPYDTCLATDSPRAGWSVLRRHAGSACLDTRLAQVQRQPGMRLDGKDSFG